MVHVFVPYKVKSASVEKVKVIVAKFISEIEKNEPGTLLYKSFQQTDKPTHFTHIMSFVDSEAEMLHKKSAYCREFTDVLYPVCEIMPKPVAQNEIN
ncbi:putative quinol monooxygenase [Flagellimonas sp. S3867]|uniref:putative quinol monooxygenase n=1 Tax=Flagellimonas sp. S3867 TaxID=2768063 RepID=UPI0016864289|nr:antibiotic biosynthesis monooxygenase [Flagellimonas sp. S3867]